ncbi:MAG: hypothetical protein LBC68_01035 [Prevotellaceae bacterium]|jgi:hypothetical protein|nr:hypothetical protein [Prevotellaceae bacterium]
MSNTKILITVKTYPTLSEKYDELVCTAGFKEDGSWVRIYPVPYRKLDYINQYHKWQWIEMDIVKNTSDFRLESYRPADIEKDFIIGEKIENWEIRKNIVLRNVYVNMEDLIAKTKDTSIGISLATLKPSQVIDFVWKECEREWDNKKLNAVHVNQAQGNLFQEKTKKLFQIAKKVPYEFSYIFKTEDGKERKLMIEDWELGQLYWNCLKKAKGDEINACQKVKQKYFDWMLKQRELYFFLGTTKRFHNIAPNPFIIIGTFYPPKQPPKQLMIKWD